VNARVNARANLATLVDQFRAQSAETAVVAHRGNRRYATTYGELAALAGRFSAELARRNIAPGDRVVLWGENSAEWIAAFFGCILRGVIAVPLDAAGASDFAARVIRDTTPKLIVGDAQLLGELNPHLKGEMRGTQSETADVQTAAPQLALSTLAERLPAEPLFTPSDAIEPHTPFQIIFTSGTTSEPRGIVHTHRNILVTLEPIEREMQKYRRYERIFHPLRFLHSIPLSHVFGQFMGLWIPALLAAEVHFVEELEPSRLTALIRRERVSVLIAVPRVLSLLRAHLLARFPTLATQLDQSAGLSILKRWWHFRRIHSALGWKFWAVISGGATLPAELETFWNHLGYALIQGYGMTETAALVTLNHPFHIKAGSIGKPMPGREVRISEDGEILVRGAMLAEATWQGGELRPREGEWLSTGDLAEQSATGELKFLGRKGDVIVTSAGLNIHPADLESALGAQPGIRSCVIVACDLAAGPEPIAVVLSTLPDEQLQEAVDAANRTLAEYQQMRRVLRWPEIEFPHTSTGKLIRRQVAAWACAALAGGSKSLSSRSASLLSSRSADSLSSRNANLLSSRSAAEGSASPADSLLATIASVTNEPVPASANPGSLRLSEDLHLDSLGRVQLQSALEHRFSVDLDEDALANAQTVADLRSLMEAAGDPLQVAGAPTGRTAQSTKSALQPSLNADAAASSPATQPATSNRQPVTLDHTYPHWPWSRPVLVLRIVWIELVMRPLVWFFAAPRVTYTSGAASQLAPGNRQPATPLLILSNHITAYDGALILYALPRHLRRHVAAAMSGEMLLDYRGMRNQGNWFLNLLAPAAYWLLTALFNVFPLPRAKGFRRSFAHAGEAMDRGYSVLIFPEGSRSHTGHINAFRPGIGLLAQQSQAPILPVALGGLYEATAPHPTMRRRWFHSGSIEVRIGGLIPAPAADADPAQLTAALEHSLRALLPEAD
jgi:long-chain acyl-CoA synthetase